jgi:hypothetical protein
MTDLDMGTFDRAFGRVCGAFRLKLKAGEQEELTRTYFRVLEPYPLDAVLGAAKVCLTKCRRFPTAADWIAELPPNPGPYLGGGAGDHRWLSADEMDDADRAAARAYVDDPCDCVACEGAGVTDLPLRFVPTPFGESYEVAYHSRRQALEVVGHWAHGEELARWYLARETFFGLAQKAPRTLFDAAAVILGDREPGMEG